MQLRDVEGKSYKEIADILQITEEQVKVCLLYTSYYIGLIDYNQKAYESAARHLDKVLEYPNNK